MELVFRVGCSQSHASAQLSPAPALIRRFEKRRRIITVNMSDEQVVTVEVDVPAEDGAPDPAAQEAAGDTEQQQDDGKHDSGSEDELETGGKKIF